MSIPRIAIERPVTMFMISMVIILLGGISLTRLPVDLMPDTQMPTITVRVNYSGVGPLEMEELVTRPIEQAVSAVAGLERVDSTSSEGNANIRLNFAWGTDLAERPTKSAPASTACAAACRKTPTRPPCSSSTPPRCPSWASASKATSTR